MISIPNCIQIILSEFVVDEVAHTLSSVIKTSIKSKFILELEQVLYRFLFCFVSLWAVMRRLWTMQTLQDSFWLLDKDS